ncbi:MAG TPA: M23 family metallopeptidase [Haliangiales bacterium]|nr:M23 family metallopeptidase [Haliangiales bacterium]
MRVLLLPVRVLPALAAWVVATALFAPLIEDPLWLAAAGAGAAIVAPLLVRWRLRRKIPFFLEIFDTLWVAALALGFADDVGRALRRHGDWFLGERTGAVARGLRATIEWAAAGLERFEPDGAFVPVVIPPTGTAPAAVAEWFHPLLGPRRLPPNGSARFGAARPQPRPPECELGHCGVDVGQAVGEPVFAAFDGTVERVERDDNVDPRAGRTVIIAHKDGEVRSRYLHLDSIRDDLRPGMRVSGGELIARLGRTGVLHSAPHLHFALDVGGRFIDPEPYLRVWRLPALALARR